MGTIKNKIIVLALLFVSTSNVLNAQGLERQEIGVWSIVGVAPAIEALFGSSRTIDDVRIVLAAPDVASNGGAVPVHISTRIPARRIALFQDVNAAALTAIWDVKENSITEYDVKIKMKSSGTLMVVVEGKDGKLYSTHKKIDVALGGCDGSGDGYYSTPVRTYSYLPSRNVSYPNRGRINTEEYKFINENIFKNVSASALSTFSTDVDTASYANLRNHLMVRNQQPPKDAVRIEEMINYFNYGYNEPRDSKPFYINTHVGKSLWNPRSKIIHIGLQTRKVDISELPQSNLVFLLDVSGSMHAENKLPLLIKSLKLLVKELRKEDRVSIVVYAGYSGLILDRARGDEKERIYTALDSLRAGGSTAGGAGITLAYDTAQRAFIQEGNNRVILATDGDFNVGVSSEDALIELIEKKRRSGVYLSVLGFGSANLKDNKMEALADKGNGNYQYIDSLLEAKKVLVTQMSGTLYTVAKDVKIQVEFNPAKVYSYRLIGYENRLLANEDFNNDKKDAGEIGMGHRVTALYEVFLSSDDAGVDALKYQKKQRNSFEDYDELATVKIRYKDPKEDNSKLILKVITLDNNEISKEDVDFAQSVAGFGMLLRGSAYAKDLTYAELIEMAKNNKGKDRDGNRAEFIRMIEKVEVMKVGY